MMMQAITNIGYENRNSHRSCYSLCHMRQVMWHNQEIKSAEDGCEKYMEKQKSFLGGNSFYL